MTLSDGRREAFEMRSREDTRARREAMESRAIRNRLEKAAGRGDGRADLGRIVALAARDALAGRSVEGAVGALRRAAQVGPARVPRNADWAEPGYKNAPEPPKRRRDDRSPQEARDLAGFPGSQGRPSNGLW